MIDAYSASASEVFAAAIQDHNRGLIVGGRSYGKGTIQTMRQLRTGAGLKLTTAGFYRINGTSTQFDGVIPDIKIPQYSDGSRGESDLDFALELNPTSGMRYNAMPGLSEKKLEKLRSNSNARISNNLEFEYLAQDLKENAELEDKPISLKMETRREMYDRRESIKEAREKERLTSGNIETPDFVLEEAKAIMFDYL